MTELAHNHNIRKVLKAEKKCKKKYGLNVLKNVCC